MNSEKKRVTVMLHDRLTNRVMDLAGTLKMSPNELVNRFVEGCLQQVDQRRKPSDPIPMVDLARVALRRNLTLGDRMLQTLLEAKVAGWEARTQRWRDLVLEEANSRDEELTDELLEEVKVRADERWRNEGN